MCVSSIVVAVVQEAAKAHMSLCDTRVGVEEWLEVCEVRNFNNCRWWKSCKDCNFDKVAIAKLTCCGFGGGWQTLGWIFLVVGIHCEPHGR